MDRLVSFLDLFYNLEDSQPAKYSENSLSKQIKARRSQITTIILKRINDASSLLFVSLTLLGQNVHDKRDTPACQLNYKQ